MALLDREHCSYGELLTRPEWKRKRERILIRDGYACQFCGTTDRSQLEVHHRQYRYVERLDTFEMPWQYPDECLITACRSCHRKGHALYRVPKIII
ncbi:MAG TPA: HNH endonuclease [Alistipes sp.]|nr:HNH endonuclease [Alistipes sp.]